MLTVNRSSIVYTGALLPALRLAEIQFPMKKYFRKAKNFRFRIGVPHAIICSLGSEQACFKSINE